MQELARIAKLDPANQRVAANAALLLAFFFPFASAVSRTPFLFRLRRKAFRVSMGSTAPNVVSALL